MFDRSSVLLLQHRTGAHLPSLSIRLSHAKRKRTQSTKEPFLHGFFHFFPSFEKKKLPLQFHRILQEKSFNFLLHERATSQAKMSNSGIYQLNIVFIVKQQVDREELIVYTK